MATLLYDLLRSASKIELFYKLRGAGDGPRRFTPKRIGHAGRTTAYKDVRRTLIREGVLSKEGAFVENGPNVWLARLPQRVQDPRIPAYIGRRIPYFIFLAIILNEREIKSPFQLARELGLTPRSTYAAISLLDKRGLIDKTKLIVSNAKSTTQLQQWLHRYLDLIIEHANLKHDNSKMFQAVPAYIDGLEALQRVNYEPGMPIGPSPMTIRTYAPFRTFWTHALDEVDDFRERERSVSLASARTDDEIVWISGLPYSNKPRPD